MEDDLVQRLRELEPRSSSSTGIARDFRVIEMHLARAEEKILRLGRTSSWTQPGFSLSLVEELDS